MKPVPRVEGRGVCICARSSKEKKYEVTLRKDQCYIEKVTCEMSHFTCYLC